MMKKLLLTLIVVTINTLYVDISFAEWTYREEVDRMTDEKRCVARTDFVKPLEPMKFPYTDTESAVFISCPDNFVDLSECLLGFVFTNSPNPVDREFDEIGPYIKARIRLDKNPPRRIKLYIGENSLVSDDRKIVKELLGHKKLLLELNWFGNGLTYFEYPIEGVSEVIEKLKEGCQVKISSDEISALDTIETVPALSNWEFKKIMDKGTLKACHATSEAIKPVKAPENLTDISMHLQFACSRDAREIKDCGIYFTFDIMPPVKILEKGVVFTTIPIRIRWDNSSWKLIKTYRLLDKNWLNPANGMEGEIINNLSKHRTLTVEIPLETGGSLIYKFSLKGIPNVLNGLLKKCKE